MLAPIHKTIKVKEDYRLIAISDIHGHLDYFKALLRKVDYDPYNDYLVILGDFVEKGDQVLETIEFVEKLATFKKCFVLTGNCEWALSVMMTVPELAKEIPNYLRRQSTNGIVRTLYNKYDDGYETVLGVQKKMETFLHDHIQFMIHLPTTLKFNDFLFVHAGVGQNQNYKNSTLSEFLEQQRFLENGHPLKETVVVGHLPTSNYNHTAINNDIIIDEEKRIISIDGGIGVKPISQLNALIIESKNGKVKLSSEKYQPLPTAILLEDVYKEETITHKISFPHYEVKLLEEGYDFSRCLHLESNQEMMIKNEFLYTRDGHLYCLDDYTDHFISASQGEQVKVIGIFGHYSYVTFNHETGWIESDLLEVRNG